MDIPHVDRHRLAVGLGIGSHHLLKIAQPERGYLRDATNCHLARWISLLDRFVDIVVEVCVFLRRGIELPEYVGLIAHQPQFTRFACGNFPQRCQIGHTHSAGGADKLGTLHPSSGYWILALLARDVPTGAQSCHVVSRNIPHGSHKSYPLARRKQTWLQLLGGSRYRWCRNARGHRRWSSRGW